MHECNVEIKALKIYNREGEHIEYFAFPFDFYGSVGMPIGVIENIDVWVHELSELGILQCLKKKNIDFNIKIKLKNLKCSALISHIMVSLHLISMDGRDFIIQPEQFERIMIANGYIRENFIN